MKLFFTNGTLSPKIYSVCSFMNAMFSSENFCFMSFIHAQSFLKKIFFRANLHISVFCPRTMHLKVASVSSGTKAPATLRKNQKGRVCLLFLFHERQKLELLQGYPYFLNALLIFMIFGNKYSKAVTVGMYARSNWWCGTNSNTGTRIQTTYTPTQTQMIQLDKDDNTP